MRKQAVRYLQLYSRFDIHVARVKQLAHTRLQHIHQWQSSICLTVAPRLTSRRRRNRCQVSEDRRRQLASHRHLLQIAYQPDVSYGVHKSGNHWATYYQEDFRLVTALRLVMDHRPYSWSSGQLFPSFGPLKQHLACKRSAADVDV